MSLERINTGSEGQKKAAKRLGAPELFSIAGGLTAAAAALLNPSEAGAYDIGNKLGNFLSLDRPTATQAAPQQNQFPTTIISSAGVEEVVPNIAAAINAASPDQGAQLVQNEAILTAAANAATVVKVNNQQSAPKQVAQNPNEGGDTFEGANEFSEEEEVTILDWVLEFMEKHNIDGSISWNANDSDVTITLEGTKEFHITVKKDEKGAPRITEMVEVGVGVMYDFHNASDSKGHIRGSYLNANNEVMEYGLGGTVARGATGTDFAFGGGVVYNVNQELSLEGSLAMTHTDQVRAGLIQDPRITFVKDLNTINARLATVFGGNTLAIKSATAISGTIDQAGEKSKLPKATTAELAFDKSDTAIGGVGVSFEGSKTHGKKLSGKAVTGRYTPKDFWGYKMSDYTGSVTWRRENEFNFDSEKSDKTDKIQSWKVGLDVRNVGGVKELDTGVAVKRDERGRITTSTRGRIGSVTAALSYLQGIGDEKNSKTAVVSYEKKFEVPSYTSEEEMNLRLMRRQDDDLLNLAADARKGVQIASIDGSVYLNEAQLWSKDRVDGMMRSGDKEGAYTYAMAAKLPVDLVTNNAKDVEDAINTSLRGIVKKALTYDQSGDLGKLQRQFLWTRSFLVRSEVYYGKKVQVASLKENIELAETLVAQRADGVSIGGISSALAGLQSMMIQGGITNLGSFQTLNRQVASTATVSELGDQEQAKFEQDQKNKTLDATDVSRSLAEGAGDTGNIPVNNPSGQPLTYTITEAPASGSLSVDADGNYVYTAANGDFDGTVSAKVLIENGVGGSDIATLTFAHTGVNDAPVGSDTNETVAEDGTLNSSVSATDVEGDSIAYSEKTAPSNGSLSVNADGSYAYTPNANYNGPDSFVIEADDGNLNGKTDITVSVTVTGENDDPVIIEVGAQIVNNFDSTSIPATTEANVDSGETFTWSMSGGNGTAAINPSTGEITGEFNADTTVTRTVNDGNGGSDSENISVDFQDVLIVAPASDDLGEGTPGQIMTGTAARCFTVAGIDVAINYTTDSGLQLKVEGGSAASSGTVNNGDEVCPQVTAPNAGVTTSWDATFNGITYTVSATGADEGL